MRGCWPRRSPWPRFDPNFSFDTLLHSNLSGNRPHTTHPSQRASRSQHPLSHISVVSYYFYSFIRSSQLFFYRNIQTATFLPGCYCLVTSGVFASTSHPITLVREFKQRCDQNTIRWSRLQFAAQQCSNSRPTH
jgi:hypothetical protein